MADNVTVDNGTGTDYGVAADKVTFSGDADQSVQLFRPIHVTGAEGSKTAVDLTTTDGLYVQGSLANNAVDSGNPIKIGGYASSSTPTSVTSGDRVNAWHSVNGAYVISGASAIGDAGVTGANSIQATNGSAGVLAAGNFVYNGSSWDRVRGNTTGLSVIGGQAHDAVWAAANQPVVAGAFASAATPSAVSADGDVVHLWAGTRGQLAVMQVDASGNVVTAGAAVGDIAHDAVDSGNPIKVGGKATSGGTPAIVATGDRVDAWFNQHGALVATNLTGATVSAPNDGTTSPVAQAYGYDGAEVTLGVASALLGYNGSTWDRVRTANTGRLQVDVVTGPSSATAGDVAHDAVDSGNPVKIGGKAATTAPTAVAAGDRVDGWFTREGAQVVATLAATIGTTGTDASAIGARLAPGGSTSLAAPSAGFVYNPTGDTWDRQRGDTTGTYMVGNVAHDIADAGNPVKIGARASSTIPTAVTTGDRVNAWANLNGAQIVSTAPHIGLNSDPWNLVHEGVRYTSAQTSAVVVAGGASEKIVVTKVQLQTEGTTAGTAILYFGTGAFSRGTSRACFDGNFIPSATQAPGVVMDGPFIAGTNGDDLLFTSVGAITIVVNVWYYVVT